MKEPANNASGHSLSLTGRTKSPLLSAPYTNHYDYIETRL